MLPPGTEMGNLAPLDPILSVKILGVLGPTSCCRLALTSKHYQRKIRGDNYVWREFCKNVLLLDPLPEQPVNPFDNTELEFFMDTYGAWVTRFHMYNDWYLVARVRRFWLEMREWLRINFNEAFLTLQPGATEDELNMVETNLWISLPACTRIFYRFVNGQRRPQGDSVSIALLGLIGGYRAFNVISNVYILPLDEVITRTRDIRRIDYDFENARTVVVVASSGSSESHWKNFALDCDNGRMSVTNKETDVTECVPSNIVDPLYRDGMLLWVEEHLRRLIGGVIKTRIRCNGNRYISQFPEDGPLHMSAVTRDVKVRASSVFLPEWSSSTEESKCFVFAYLIRMSFRQNQGRSFHSCQLTHRNWTVVDGSQSVQGRWECVADQKPILHEDEREFKYKSMTPLKSTSGWQYGHYEFTPGSVADPKGDSFEVQIPRMTFVTQGFIY